ncbi:MAG TPA: DUF2993 domain-containing protein [Trebonia sp.]
MSDYQSRGQGGWPTQPPTNDGYGQANNGYGQAAKEGYGQAANDGYGQANEGYGQAANDGYGQADYGNGPGSYDQPGYGSRAARPPRRRRRRRWPIVLLVIVILILVALGIGDQVAKGYAQNRIAQQIQTSGLNTKPSVKIEGWPFLTQVASHDLKVVDISANNVTADGGKLPFDFTAKATGVHLNSSFSGATVDQINGQAVVPFSSVLSLVPGLPGGTATISADPANGPDAVKVDVAPLGTLSGTVKLVSPSEISVQLASGSGLGSFLSQLGGDDSINITIPTLPAGLVVKSVSVNSQGIVAAASASNTTLSQ